MQICGRRCEVNASVSEPDKPQGINKKTSKIDWKNIMLLRSSDKATRIERLGVKFKPQRLLIERDEENEDEGRKQMRVDPLASLSRL